MSDLKETYLGDGAMKMSVRSYLNAVMDRSFIDYDGYGHPIVDGTEDKTVVLLPSHGASNIPKKAKHINWYSR